VTQPVEGQAEHSAAPVCFRHPDRETYIRCGHCDRPICPDCMIAAPVGFHCPECVARDAASIRTPRTVAGGKLVNRPTVTYAVIAFCVAIFGLEAMSGTNQAIERFGMVGGYIAINGEWYRLVTSAFLHVSIFHIGMNMYVLFIVAPIVERFLGHVRFLLLYLLAGLGGGVASYYFSSPNIASVGASGAIFGTMGALLIVSRRLHADIRQALILIGLNLGLGFLVPGIDWRAHLGGLFVGFALAALFTYAPRRNRLLLQIAGVVAIVALLVGSISLRTHQLRFEFLQTGQLAAGMQSGQGGRA
jgi:membrane associated rhomboid family serine protease